MLKYRSPAERLSDCKHYMRNYECPDVPGGKDEIARDDIAFCGE